MYSNLNFRSRDDSTINNMSSGIRNNIYSNINNLSGNFSIIYIYKYSKNFLFR